MLKNLTIALVLTALISGCGGGGGGGSKKSSSSSLVASSVAVSSVVASSSSSSVSSSIMPSSSVSSSSSMMSSSTMSSSSSSADVVVTSSSAQSSSVASSSSMSNIINADMTAGWSGEGTGNTGVTYAMEGVSFNAGADGIGASFSIAAPVQLENAVIEMVVNVSSEFQISGANLQPYAQIKGANWTGEWECVTNNSELIAATDVTITCTIDDPANEFNQTQFDVKVGVLAKGTPTGIVTIKSAKVTLSTQASSSVASSSVASSSIASSSVDSSSVASSSAASSSSVVSIDLTTGWQDNGPNTHAYSNAGVTYTFSTGDEVYTLAPAGIPLIGKTLNFVMNVSPEYKASTASLKLYIQNTGNWAWMDLWVNNSDLVAGVDTNYSFPITSTIAALDGTNAFRVGLQPAAAAGGGTILIKSITVTPTP